MNPHKIELSEAQRREIEKAKHKAEQEKNSAFMEEYLGLVKKHRRMQVPLINYEATGIQAIMQIKVLSDEEMGQLFPANEKDDGKTRKEK